jgi:transposase
MIVIGADPHKRTHTVCAVDAATGELRSSETVAASRAGHAQLIAWGRSLGDGRVWAIEDCRHVSGGLERALVDAGERVVRVAPKLMAGQRRSARQRGKSDEIDALAVARAALREGIDTLPTAHLDEAALELKLLSDHRDNLVADRADSQRRLRWHLHDLWPDYEIPTGALDRTIWLDKTSRKLARADQTARVRVAKDLIRSIRQSLRQERTLQKEIAGLVNTQAPQLLHIPGCGPLTAARIIAETAGAGRFKTDAQFARLAGVAPIPVSTGNTNRHRLDRQGNRRLNCAIHRIAITQARTHPPARTYLNRKQTEGKTTKEAIRALKRHLARTIHNTLTTQPTPQTT